jgi:hypothetical protein
VRAGAALQDRARRLWRWFFPERVEPPPEALAVIRAVYPTLDLGAVSFHAGVPHLIRLVGSLAITLPAVMAPRRTRVYVAPRGWDPADVEGLGTLVHEAYHALQVQETGWGFGPLRPFLVLYFAHGAANGFRYHGHAMEEDAYRVAGRRHSPFEAACHACGAPPIEAVGQAELATPSSGLRFWRGMARSLAFAPSFLAVPLLPLWLLTWTGAASLVWLGRLLVEAFGAGAAGLLWVAGAILSPIEKFLFRHPEDL